MTATRNNPDTVLVRHGRYTGMASADIDPAPVLALIAATIGERCLPGLGPAPANNSGNGQAAPELVKEKLDKGSRVYRARARLSPRPEAEAEEVYIKTFDNTLTMREMLGRIGSPKSLRRPHHYPLKTIRIAFEPSIARRCFHAARACESAGLPAADHALYLERRRGHAVRGLVVTRAVPDSPAPDARLYFENVIAPPNPPEARAERRALVGRLGRLLQKACDSGLTFQDFKLHNLVLSFSGGEGEYFLIDLAEVKTDMPCEEAVFLRRFAESLTCFRRADLARLARAYAGDSSRGVDARTALSLLLAGAGKDPEG